MRIKYFPQDHDQRVNGGIVRYNNSPYVLNLNGPQEFVLSPIYRKANANQITIKGDDPLLDISSPPLGYINGKAACIYVMRKPERKYKQTLRPDAVLGYYAGGTLVGQDVIHSVLFSKQGEQMFLGVYPEFKFATSKITNDLAIESIALSRHVALYRVGESIIVLIKNEPVGTYIHADSKVILKKSDYSWISERYLSRFDWKIE